MSQVFVCGCGRKTTAPFMIGIRKMCTVCADEERPDLVDKRERQDVWHNREHRIPMRKYGNRDA
jgi:hypothetical protein